MDRCSINYIHDGKSNIDAFSCGLHVDYIIMDGSTCRAGAAFPSLFYIAPYLLTSEVAVSKLTSP